MEDINLNQLKLKLHGTYMEDGKITTNIEQSNGEDVVNKAHLDTKIAKMKGLISFIEKEYNEVN